MALTVAIKNRMSVGNQWEVQADVAFDNSYPTGGLSLAPAMLGLMVVKDLMGDPKSGYAFEYDYTGQKLKAMQSGHDVKVIGGLTSSEALFLDASQKLGKVAATDRTVVGATAATTGGVLAGPSVEVPNGTDLSALTGVKVTARGL